MERILSLGVLSLDILILKLERILVGLSGHTPMKRNKRGLALCCFPRRNRLSRPSPAQYQTVSVKVDLIGVKYIIYFIVF